MAAILKAANQAAMRTIRKNHRATAILQSLPVWASGKTATAGQYCQSLGSAYIAVTSGTTGATAPTGTSGTVSDGGVDWQYVFPKSLLQFLYAAPLVLP